MIHMGVCPICILILKIEVLYFYLISSARKVVTSFLLIKFIWWLILSHWNKRMKVGIRDLVMVGWGGDILSFDLPTSNMGSTTTAIHYRLYFIYSYCSKFKQMESSTKFMFMGSLCRLLILDWFYMSCNKMKQEFGEEHRESD